MRKWMLLLGLFLASAPAQARWQEASSEHFVIYADDSPSNVRQFSERLERFHSAVMAVLRVEDVTPSPSNRVTVYVLPTVSHVQQLYGGHSDLVAGFYHPSAGGSFAAVSPIDSSGTEPDFSLIALLHEYTHHVTYTVSSAPLPAWLVEGSAEFFASARFEKDGSVSLGMPAKQRYGELLYARDVRMTELLNPVFRLAQTSDKYSSFYGKSWLLYHYLFFNKARSGQLPAYMKAVLSGTDSVAAARAVFGDLKKLDDELDDYLDQHSIMTIKMPVAALTVRPVTIRELRPGEAAIMISRIRSKRGVNRKTALDILPDARKVAAQYPDDPAVLSELAEAEHDAGNPDASIAAADKALAIDPNTVNAYVQKGYSLFDKAEKAADKPGAYKAAVVPFLALNKIEPDHPLPLMYFYSSLIGQGKPPGEQGLAALRRAAELAPFDTGLRGMLAFALIRNGDMDEAVANLQPIAYAPHGGQASEWARGLIDRIHAGAKSEDLIKDGKLIEVGPSATPKKEPSK